mmetsp:Transcript_30505/g.71899  ORF Transcript_30505/g.71899 Transcript_30505/m.71899 type:complete len:320 (+) Transcript_30505:218-1177(+)
MAMNWSLSPFSPPMSGLKLATSSLSCILPCSWMTITTSLSCTRCFFCCFRLLSSGLPSCTGDGLRLPGAAPGVGVVAREEARDEAAASSLTTPSSLTSSASSALGTGSPSFIASLRPALPSSSSEEASLPSSSFCSRCLRFSARSTSLAVAFHSSLPSAAPTSSSASSSSSKAASAPASVPAPAPHCLACSRPATASWSSSSKTSSSSSSNMSSSFSMSSPSRPFSSRSSLNRGSAPSSNSSPLSAACAAPASPSVAAASAAALSFLSRRPPSCCSFPSAFSASSIVSVVCCICGLKSYHSLIGSTVSTPVEGSTRRST